MLLCIFFFWENIDFVSIEICNIVGYSIFPNTIDLPFDFNMWNMSHRCKTLFYFIFFSDQPAQNVLYAIFMFPNLSAETLHNKNQWINFKVVSLYSLF